MHVLYPGLQRSQTLEQAWSLSTAHGPNSARGGNLRRSVGFIANNSRLTCPHPAPWSQYVRKHAHVQSEEPAKNLDAEAARYSSS